jgi:hypothetical protein
MAAKMLKFDENDEPEILVIDNSERGQKTTCSRSNYLDEPEVS